VSIEQDQARSIAERVARRVQTTTRPGSNTGNSKAAAANGSPVREELSAIREGLHDLESKLDRIESKIVQGGNNISRQRARVIDFVSSSPPVVISPSIGSPPASKPTVEREENSREFVPPTQSPWLRNFPGSIDHPSQERFGVEEAAVTELVEFFENEKKCSVDPSGKPCDHCAMCISRGF